MHLCYLFKANHFQSTFAERFYDGDPNELSVSIPTYVMRGVGSQTHHEYEVRITVGHERYTILRRYNRFRELHSEMMHKYGEQVRPINELKERNFN